MFHIAWKLIHSISGVHRLFEVDHFGLPKDWVDMPNFVWLYEAVIKWAVSTCMHSLSICILCAHIKLTITFFANIVMC